jgi:hypothetical protein
MSQDLRKSHLNQKSEALFSKRVPPAANRYTIEQPDEDEELLEYEERKDHVEDLIQSQRQSKMIERIKQRKSASALSSIKSEGKSMLSKKDFEEIRSVVRQSSKGSLHSKVGEEATEAQAETANPENEVKSITSGLLSQTTEHLNRS